MLNILEYMVTEKGKNQAYIKQMNKANKKTLYGKTLNKVMERLSLFDTDFAETLFRQIFVSFFHNFHISNF